MDFRFEFTTKLKEYLDDEKDEKVIKDGHRDIIFHYLYALESEIGVVKNPNFTFLHQEDVHILYWRMLNLKRKSM